jgi:leucyl aminopeptidase
MKNSVKDRSNAQASCAANFIYEHLHPDYAGGWLHVDLAGPAFLDDRGTGCVRASRAAPLGVQLVQPHGGSSRVSAGTAWA